MLSKALEELKLSEEHATLLASVERLGSRVGAIAADQWQALEADGAAAELTLASGLSAEPIASALACGWPGLVRVLFSAMSIDVDKDTLRQGKLKSPLAVFVRTVLVPLAQFYESSETAEVLDAQTQTVQSPPGFAPYSPFSWADDVEGAERAERAEAAWRRLRDDVSCIAEQLCACVK